MDWREETSRFKARIAGDSYSIGKVRNAEAVCFSRQSTVHDSISAPPDY
jgi:hypothetical protein